MFFVSACAWMSAPENNTDNHFVVYIYNIAGSSHTQKEHLQCLVNEEYMYTHEIENDLIQIATRMAGLLY